MISNLINQSSADQFLHLRQDLKRKQEEQARHMKGLQGQAKRLQHENDQLRAHIEKSHDPGKDVRDNGHTVHPVASNKGKESIAPDNRR